MCRSIKVLRGMKPRASRADVQAAALQFVRKVSGFRAPAKRNALAFDRAVEEVTAAAERLLSVVDPLEEKSAGKGIEGAGSTEKEGPDGVRSLDR